MKRFIAPPSFCFIESSSGIMCFFSFRVAPPDGRASVVMPGVASRVGASIMPPWQLALLSVMPSGVSRASVTEQRFVPRPAAIRRIDPYPAACHSPGRRQHHVLPRPPSARSATPPDGQDRAKKAGPGHLAPALKQGWVWAELAKGPVARVSPRKGWRRKPAFPASALTPPAPPSRPRPRGSPAWRRAGPPTWRPRRRRASCR